MIQEFLSRGYVVIKGAFPRKEAEAWVAGGFSRLGYDPADPKTWTETRVPLPAKGRNAKVSDFAPKVWSAILELVGGEDRILDPEHLGWSDSFRIKFPIAHPAAWAAPSVGWHLDRAPDGAPHFLDSAVPGLLTWVLWSDLELRGGGTFIAPASVGAVARRLAGHPEGLSSQALDPQGLMESCPERVQLTGEAGDVVLAHPYMLHAESDNALSVPRFLTAHMVALKAPLDLDREDPGDFSPVERAALAGLGVPRFSFRRTAAAGR